MTHVRTFTMLGSPFGIRMNWALAARYVTWAMTGMPDSIGISRAGIKTILYTEPNRTRPGLPLYTSDATTFSHSCSGARVYVPAKNLYVMRPASAHLASLWVDFVKQHLSGAHFDAIYEDSTSGIAGARNVPCGFTQAQWTSDQNLLNSRMPYRIISNSLFMPGQENGLTLPWQLGLIGTEYGAGSEGCYDGYNLQDRRVAGLQWQAQEDTELRMAAAGKLFICSAYQGGSGATSFALAVRMYQFASFLLTYDPVTSVLDERNWTTASGFDVQPESQLVALQPRVPRPLRVSALLQPGGAFAREYAACYYKGRLVGRCAVVVNSNKLNVPAAFPWPAGYHHTAVLSGSGVLDSGTVSFNGPAPPASMPARTAVIAFP